MARARNIKPALFTNEVLGVADPMYTLLFEGLWLLADRAGRLEDRPLRIKGELFPYRDGLDIDAMLTWLDSNDFIIRYQVDGKRYIEITNFVKHQNPHKNEAESKIPCASIGCKASEKIGTASEDIGSAPADSLIPDSGFLIPDPLTSPTPPASAGVGLFDRFWKLYPRKIGKGNAEKAWKKLKVTQPLFDRICAALAAQVNSPDWKKDGGQFIPHPATWLNGKRWEDELPTNVHMLPGSRHSGFESRDYGKGLIDRGDGTYDF